MEFISRGIFALLMIVACYGCDSTDYFILDGFDEDKTKEVRVLIEGKLEVGSASEEIVGFFNRHGIDFTYDRFSRRYQAIVRDVGGSEKVDQSVIIYVYVDEDYSFLSFEVNDSFTAI